MTDEKYTYIGPDGKLVNDMIEEDRKLSEPKTNFMRTRDQALVSRSNNPVLGAHTARSVVTAIGMQEARNAEGRNK